MLLWHRLQVNLAFSIENDLGNLAVKFVHWCPQSLLQLLCHKAAAQGPLLERLSNQIVGKALEIAVAQFDLAVVGVEHNAVLNDFDLPVGDLVLSN